MLAFSVPSTHLLHPGATLLDGGSSEVELISLLEEKIPKYKLRFDTITEFTGALTVCQLFVLFIIILIGVTFEPAQHRLPAQ